MAGIFQGDILIKTAIELALIDFKKNPWLIDHMLSDLTAISYFQTKYGQAQIDSCKEWLRNNQIDVYMRGRNDTDRLPCVTIEMGPSNEKEGMKTMADQSTETIQLMPQDINKTIPYIVQPFTGWTYDDITGELHIPSSVDFAAVVANQLVVNPSNGNGYMIHDIGTDYLLLDTGLTITATQLGVLPQFRYYIARIEHAFFQESYKIGCHAHGDPQVMLWLWSIAKYAILRYRESLLEANGFCESKLSSNPPGTDNSWSTNGGETAWTRYMVLDGQVENTWIKSPKRIIESVISKDTDVPSAPDNGGPGGGSGSAPIPNPPTSQPTWIGGIKIISNTQPVSDIEAQLLTWYPIDQAHE